MSALRQEAGGEVSRFSGTLIDLLDRVEYRRVSPDDLHDPVYRLRYDAYRREEFIPINSEHTCRDEFDDLPNAHCFGVYIDGELVSSVRLHYVTPDFRASPTHAIFSDVLDPILDQGHTIIDPGRFTTDLEASLAYPALPFLTLRIPTIAVGYYHVKYVLSTVRAEHAGFYRRVYRSQQLSDAERRYHGLKFPMVLLASDAPVVYPGLLRRFPFFRSTAEEREALFGEAGHTRISVVRPSVRLAMRLEELAEAPA